jgi:hypothetical protein
MSDKFYPVKPLNDSGAFVPGLRLVDDGNGGFAIAAALSDSNDSIGQVGGHVARPSTTFTRPNDTTPYTLGDLVANSTTAGSVIPMSFAISRTTGLGGMLRRLRLRKTGTSLTNASFRVHFYSVSPTCSNGDNGVWLTNQAGSYVGFCDVSLTQSFTDGAGGNGIPAVGSEINFTADTYYALLEARQAYTPVAQEQFTLSLELLQN